MLTSHLNDKEKNFKIRRYLDYSKLIDLLNKKSLYFATPDQFEDTFDSYLPDFEKKIYELLDANQIANLHENTLKAAIKLLDKVITESVNEFQFKLVITFIVEFSNLLFANEPKFKYDAKTMNEIGKIASYLMENIQNIHKFFIKRRIVYDMAMLLKTQHLVNCSNPENYKKAFLINCWSICEKDNNESNLMWKVYGKTEGFAIETTPEKLQKHLDVSNYGTGEIRLVEYCDLNEKFDGLKLCNQEDFRREFFKFIFYKRKAFSAEKELRVVLANEIGNSAGSNIPIISPLTDFIDNIVVSPYAPQNYETLKGLLKKYNMDQLIEKVILSKI